MAFERYVAIGDSSTEGLNDPDGRGGYRGWANRLAQHLADLQGEILYANLGIRGKRTRAVREQQLECALAMEPDLVTLFCGTNDVIGRRFELAAFAADVDDMHKALRAANATVLSFTLPDLAPIMPLAHLVRGRLDAMNQTLRELAAVNGVLLVDFAAHRAASDRRLWSEDRLHANALGHERIAAALGHALGLPGFDSSWAQPLPEGRIDGGRAKARFTRLGGEFIWCGRYLVPWIIRHARGRSSGDERRPKRPQLASLSAQRKSVGSTRLPAT